MAETNVVPLDTVVVTNPETPKPKVEGIIWSEEIETTGDEYLRNLRSVFTTAVEPGMDEYNITPEFDVGAETNPGTVRLAIEPILEKGLALFTKIQDPHSINLNLVEQAAMYERALDYVHGERTNSDSYYFAVKDMVETAKILAEIDFGNRVDIAYEAEGGDKKLLAGRLIKGLGKKEYVIRPGRHMGYLDYKESSNAHAELVGEVALTGIQKPYRERAIRRQG